MYNLLICGCSGKMGGVVARLANEYDCTVVAGFDKYIKPLDFPVYDNFDDVKMDIDIIIDFSKPETLSDLLSFATSKKIPVIIATTGHTASQAEEIHKASSIIPIFYSANLSLGINLIAELAKQAASLLQDNFDIEILEKHHNQKVDAPSGTAIMLADKISSVLSYNSNYVYDRHIKREKRDKKEIGFSSIRGGTIVGEHEVIFAGTDEVITIGHTAMSKEVFAVGALKAVSFLVSEKPGLYDMTNLVAKILNN
ncbi:MAG: 4-hydroxy-tetrahydrodipicolinate reductase [Clostridia bacterium]